MTAPTPPSDYEPEHPAVPPEYLAATLLQRRRQWERHCAEHKTTPDEGVPWPWLAQPKGKAS